jgi:Tol biopolymer transport system component
MRCLTSIALIALTSGVAQAAPHVLDSQDLFHMQWATDPQIRADGAQIAYAREVNDIMTDQLVKSLWLIDVATGAQTPLATGSGSYSSPRWSPDGTRIAYLATDKDGRTQIAMRWMRGEAAANITNLTETPADITWSPDGKQIAFIMLTPAPGPTIGKMMSKPKGATWAPEPVVIDSMNFRADGQGMEKPGFRHVFVLSADGGGAPRQLTFGPFSDAGPLAWSSDGKSIFFAGNHSEEWKREPQDWARHTSMTLSIYRLNVADGGLTQLSKEVGPYHAPVVSPDGKLIAYLGYTDKHVGNQSVRLSVMDTDGGNSRVVTESLDRSINKAEWAADGHSLYADYVDHGITKVSRVGLNGKV